MKDKERILMVIITRLIPVLKYGNKDEYVETNILDGIELNKGDLVFANTTIHPNDFCVGFVEEQKENYTIIREIGSDKLCEYYNESFTRINKDILGYEILEGVQYQIYQKVLKAFSGANYCTRFKSIRFDGNMCYVESRMMFEDETTFEISFNYNSKTTIKEILKLIEEKV